MDEKKLVRNSNKKKFPSNTNKPSRDDQLDKKEKIQAVVSTPVIRKKKSFLNKAMNAIMGDDDVKSVKDYILFDVLIPALKGTITDMITGGIEMALYGEQRSIRSRSNIRRSGPRSYTSYNSYYHSKGSTNNRRDSFGRRERATHSFDDIIFATRGEAETVLSHLSDLTIDYDAASVADFYELAGITPEFTDDKYGWTNLRDAMTERTRAGYVLRLPPPRPLD